MAKVADPLVDEPNYGSRRLRISLVEIIETLFAIREGRFV
jgi:hypothetical protein